MQQQEREQRIEQLRGSGRWSPPSSMRTLTEEGVRRIIAVVEEAHQRDLVLTATASSGNSFGGWGSDCGSASNTSSSLTTTVQMTQAHTCTASFSAGGTSTQLRGVNLAGMNDATYKVISGPQGLIAGTTYSTTYYNNFKSTVDYATGQGIQVIIEPWTQCADNDTGPCRDGNFIDSTNVPSTAFADFWGRMAANFKDNSKVSYGLINEPRTISAAQWFQAAQAAIVAIRATGSTQRIYVPGMDYASAKTFTSNGSSDAFLQYINDPGNNVAIEVHDYLNSSGSGGDDCITSATAAGDNLNDVVGWAAQNHLKVYIGEIGLYAGFDSANPGTYPSDCHFSGVFAAADVWANFINYFSSRPDALEAFTWWAGGDPNWWKPAYVHGGSFSIAPTNTSSNPGDTINMVLIRDSFL